MAKVKFNNGTVFVDGVGQIGSEPVEVPQFLANELGARPGWEIVEEGAAAVVAEEVVAAPFAVPTNEEE